MNKLAPWRVNSGWPQVNGAVHASITEKRRRFEAQVLPHLDAAYNLARWLARSPSDSDDIVQEAMLRAFRAFDGVRVNDVKPWLLAIVRNCCFTAARRGRQSMNVSLPGEGAEAEGPALRDETPDPEVSSIQVPIKAANCIACS